MKVRIKLDHAKIKRIEEAMLDSAAGALEAVHTDLAASQTMPFDIGDMQNNQTFVDRAENGAVLITGAPQARRLYYHRNGYFIRSISGTCSHNHRSYDGHGDR